MATVCQAIGDEKLPPEPQTGEVKDIAIPDHNDHKAALQCNVSQIIIVSIIKLSL